MWRVSGKLEGVQPNKEENFPLIQEESIDEMSNKWCL